MEYLYQLRTDTTVNEENSLSTYGITALKIEESIPNIFTNEDDAKNFIDLCNKEKLELIHLHSVIEDMIIVK